MKKTMKRTKWWLPALILLTAFQLISMAQVVFNDDGSLSTECLIFFGAYLAVEWVYFIAMSIARKRADPALEMIAFFLTGIGLVTVAGANKDLVKTQFVADMLGIFCFVALLWLISNVDRAMFMRTPMAVAAIGLLVLTQSPAVWYCADCVSSTTLETPFVMVVMTGVSNTFKATVPLV